MTLETYNGSGIVALAETNFNNTSALSFTFFYFTP
jgi:hypothetical protein